MTRARQEPVRSGPSAAGIGLALLSAGGFGTSGIFGSALIRSGWSPAAATLARLVVPALLLAVPAVLQLRGRWVLLRSRQRRPSSDRNSKSNYPERTVVPAKAALIH
jgi:hypothetical protein